MELLTTDAGEVADLVLWLRNDADENDRPHAGRAIGVLCVDGRDVREEPAPCGCVAQWRYEHATEPGPGLEECAPSELDRCEGWIRRTPERAEFWTCDLHAARHQAAIESRYLDAIDDVWFDHTGEWLFAPPLAL